MFPNDNPFKKFTLEPCSCLCFNDGFNIIIHYVTKSTEILLINTKHGIILNNTENKIALQEYLDNNKEKCQTTETLPILLKGSRQLLPVYKIPLNYLFFNIRNGRFKAEYAELIHKSGGQELDPTVPEDAIRIQNLLLNLNASETKRTIQDIQQRGQWNPGIMTHDGFVIDGNRRLSILQKLAKKDSKFDEMKIARLPPTVDKNDLWKLEAGIQLGMEEIVRYNPINELLKLKEGVDANLSTNEIATTLYGYQDNKKILKKLRLLELIEEYLEFNGTPNQYSAVSRRIEKFIDAQNILDYYYNREEDAELRTSLKRAIWGLIRDNQSHWDIRKLRDMIKYQSKNAFEWIKKIAENSKPKTPETIIFQTVQTSDDHDGESIDEKPESGLEEEKPISAIGVMWTNAMDALSVTKNENDLPRLLNTAIQNLDGINYDNKQLKTAQCRELIEKIIHHADKLKELV